MPRQPRTRTLLHAGMLTLLTVTVLFAGNDEDAILEDAVSIPTLKTKKLTTASEAVEATAHPLDIAFNDTSTALKLHVEYANKSDRVVTYLSLDIIVVDTVRKEIWRKTYEETALKIDPYETYYCKDYWQICRFHFSQDDVFRKIQSLALRKKAIIKTSVNKVCFDDKGCLGVAQGTGKR